MQQHSQHPALWGCTPSPYFCDSISVRGRLIFTYRHKQNTEAIDADIIEITTRHVAACAFSEEDVCSCMS